MNITTLSYFLEACRTRNFTKEAENLYISPQGVSKAVKSLEAELSCVLFLRCAHGLELTECGEALCRSAGRIVEEAEQARERIRELSGSAGRCVRLGVIMGANMVLGNAFLTELRERAAGTVLMPVEAWDLLCEREVLNGAYDLAVTGGPVDEEQFVSWPLRRGRMCAFVHCSHPLFARDALTIDELCGERFITVNRNYRLYHAFTAACRTRGFEPKIVGATISINKTCQACTDKRVIGINNSLTAGKEECLGFRLIPIVDRDCGWELALIAKRGRRLSPETERVCEIILDYAGMGGA